MHGPIRVRGALCILLLLCPPAARAAGWSCVRTPHFTLYSASPPDSVLRLARGLERMADLVARRGLGSTSKMRTRIVLVGFPDKRSFQPHQPVDDGKRRDVAGYAIHTPAGHWIGFAEYDPRGGLVAHHEYLHTLVADAFERVPLCLNEGLAEYYSTFTPSPDGVRFGHSLPWHEYALNTHEPFSADELFATGPDSPAYRGGEAQATFYAESWALVRYLMRTNSGSARFIKMVSRIADGSSAREAFAVIYPEEPWADLPARLRAYVLSEDAEPYSEISLDSPLDSVRVVLRPARPGEVLAQTGLWRARAQNVDPKATAEILERALAEAPGLGLALAGLGLVALRTRDRDEAVRRFHAALADTADPAGPRVAGIGLIEAGLSRDSTGRDSLVGEGRSALMTVTRLDPYDAAAEAWLERTPGTTVVNAPGSVGAGAGEADGTPRDWPVIVDHVNELIGRHEYSEAFSYLNSLSDPPPRVASMLVGLRDTLARYVRHERSVELYNQGVAELNLQHLAAAKQLFEQLQTPGADSELRSQAQARLLEIAAMTEYERGRAALRENRYAAALASFQKVEAMAPTANLKAQAHHLVEQLRPLVPSGGTPPRPKR